MGNEPTVTLFEHQEKSEEALSDELRSLKRNQFLYWSDVYWQGEEGTRPVVISTVMPNREDLAMLLGSFDQEFYLQQNPDVAAKSVDPLLHFMTIGWIEHRDPSPEFSVSYYLRHNKDIRRVRTNPYTHYLKSGRNERWRKSASVAEAKVLGFFETDEDMQKLVAEAKELEPMVAMPNVPRRQTTPFVSAQTAANVAKSLRQALAGKTYRYIVAVPHVRMSGASRVASIFAEALGQVRDPAEILVITTDSSENEYIGWFSDELDIFDLYAEIQELGAESHSRILLDLMRGVNCNTLINVNSRLVWDSMRLFGRQLHREFRMITYLFTWEENVKGDRVGYPIQWLRDTADYHHLLLTDTKNLADDVSTRLGFGRLEGDAQVLALYTPAAKAGAVANRQVSLHEKPRILWAGRFDAQKRVDILIAIAEANPSLIFDVYGKAVLDKKALEDYNPPANIIPQGTYTDLQEVLDTPYAGFLYTAQWDGLPTILLDMAVAGLPIVAPNVGGIAELLDQSTGWVIEDCEDVAGYSTALKEILRDPKLADQRAEALKIRLADQFAPQRYIENIEKLVTAYDL